MAPTNLTAKGYYPEPYSLAPLTPHFKVGLALLSVSGLASVLTTSFLLSFILYHFISWRRHNPDHTGYNQYVVLIFSLLVGDWMQGMAFVISLHWIQLDMIVAPTAACFLQAFFLHLGDVSSGFGVLAIAVHTWISVVKGWRLRYRNFLACVLFLWVAAILLTIVGPLTFRNGYFFTRAGNWCWISKDYESERLWLHYIWIFIVELSMVFIYGHIFFHIRGRIKGAMVGSTDKLSKANSYMLLYPFVYMVCTLPLAIGRMLLMTGHVVSPDYFFAAGFLITSCGWLDTLVYTLTRRVLVNTELRGTTAATTTHRTATTHPDRPPGSASASAKPLELNTMLSSYNVSVSGEKPPAPEPEPGVRARTVDRFTRSVSRAMSRRRAAAPAASSFSAPGSRADADRAGVDSAASNQPFVVGIWRKTDVHTTFEDADPAAAPSLAGVAEHPPSDAASDVSKSDA